MIFSEKNTQIAAALAKAWGEIQNPKHNTTVKVQTKTGGSYTFDYTDLGGIFDEAKRVYKENEISILQNAYTEESDGRLVICVETMLLHSSGEWVKSGPLRMMASPGIQDMGGQITYLKRYSLSAMLGIATEKDDDANGASGNEYQYESKKESGDPPTTLKSKFQTLKGSMEQFEEWVEDQKSKGFSYAQMEQYLAKLLLNRKKGA